MLDRVTRPLTFSVIFGLASACASDPAPAPPVSKGPAYRAVADVRDTMNAILDPATDVIWASAGTIITAEGERDLSPTTDEGWEDVRRQALVVSESGNLLMVPGRSEGPAWDAFAAALIVAGEHAAEAAAAQDRDALFDAGGEMYVVCRGCHAQYLIDEDEDDGEATRP